MSKKETQDSKDFKEPKIKDPKIKESKPKPKKVTQKKEPEQKSQDLDEFAFEGFCCCRICIDD